ncbi:UDP-glucosyltransferase 2-like [Anticarsia gemmatalis]|uniref:UDP-glucosyltransferase 2-like n=1 Tax=Anticarsia gemmatalis TaxID=129554 RepID=UPI003F76082C
MRSSVLFFLSLLCCSQSYKILVSYTLPVKSVNILGEGVVRHLLNDGHEVTFITTHPLKNPPTKNFRQIDVSGLEELFYSDETLSINYIINNQVQDNDVHHVQEMARNNAENTFKNENMTKFLQDTNEHFDAVVIDLFESEVYAGLAALYNCSFIYVYSMGAHWQVVRLISDTANPAYDPDYLLTNIPPFSFVQRVQELYQRMVYMFYKTFSTLPSERRIYEQAFGPLLKLRGRELPDYEDVIYNASLIFGNEHNAIIKRPMTPQNFKYVGGFHVQDPVKPLPKDLQEAMDNAPHGVIYFSMGSLWKSKALPTDITRGILNVFGELKQTVIWKYEDDLKDLPKNVKIVKWAPQQSILAHPNCKFFISHGGLLSSIEAMHFGVPIIGIPVLFDQVTNVKKAMWHGYALNVDLDWDLPKNLKVAINEMLSSDKYRTKAKELSFIYHDRPVKPGVELAHWVRHVIRTGGAPHMRSPALNVPLYQRLYLDLLALIIAIYYVLKKSLSSLMKKNKSVSKKKKQ